MREIWLLFLKCWASKERKRTLLVRLDPNSLSQSPGAILGQGVKQKKNLTIFTNTFLSPGTHDQLGENWTGEIDRKSLKNRISYQSLRMSVPLYLSVLEVDAQQSTGACHFQGSKLEMAKVEGYSSLKNGYF